MTRPYGCLPDKASLQSEGQVNGTQWLEVRKGFDESQLREGFLEVLGFFSISVEGESP